MAVVLRRNLGEALTYDQLDDNFVDYTTFRDKFDQADWIGDNDGKLLFYNNSTGKLELKSLTSSDLDTGVFSSAFNDRLALKTTNDLAEGTNNSVGESAPGQGDGTNRLYYTTARANADFDTRLATKSTTNLSEGSNLYYTDARVLTKINATSVTALSDIPSAVVTDDAKVVTYDANTDSFRYSTLLTESLLPVTDHGLITDGNVVTGSTGVTTTSLQSLTNVNFASVSGAIDGNVLVYDQTAAEWKAGVITSSGGVVNTGVTTFDALSDTPTDFVGHAGKIVRVKSAEDGVEFHTLTTNDIGEGGSKFYFSDSRFNTTLATKTTTDLAEGSNLYYTDTRADSRVALHTGANLNLGSKTSDELAEGSTNLYYTDTRADDRINTTVTRAFVDNLYVGTDSVASINGLTGAVTIDTDNITEGLTNLYYTDTRADARIVAAGSANWNTAYGWGDHSTQGYLTDITGQPFTTLSDVTAVTSSDDGKVLYYDHSNSDFRWKSISSINDLADVDTTGIANSKILKYNASSSKWVIADDTGGGGGATDFASLTDTPANFTGSANKFVKVNSGETGVEFVTDPGYLQNLSALNTDSLSEGATNLYYTDARADARADARIAAASVFDLSNVPSSISLANTNANSIAKLNDNKDGIEFVSVGSTVYSPNSTTPTGIVSLTTGPLDATLSWTPPTEAGMLTLLGSSLNTSNVTENTNLYYTDARADARIALASLTALADVDTVTSSDNNKVLYYDHATTSFKWTAQSGGGGGGTPGGVDTQVQFNDSSSFGGDSTFTFNKTTDTLTVKNIVVEGSLSPTSNSGGIFTITSPTKIVLQPTTIVETTGPFKLSAHASGSLPTADAGSMIAISNNGYKPAYYDGSAWRYVHDNSTV